MPEHTGGMVALLPDAESAARLALPDHRGGLPRDELHVTLAFLGDDVTGWTETERAQARNAVRAALVDVGISSPIDARAFAHATFNPDRYADRDPCAVYLVGDSRRIVPLRDAVLWHLRNHCPGPLVEQHEPFVPHMTAGYGLVACDLDGVGPIRFDRVVVALADEWVALPLGPASVAA